MDARSEVDETPESPVKYLTGKRLAINNALNICFADIAAAPDDLTLDRAIELGGNYASYKLEDYLHQHDDGEKGREEGASYLALPGVSADLDRVNTERYRMEEILRDAQTGNYLKLKSYLKSKGEIWVDFSESPKRSVSYRISEAEKDRKFGVNMIRIAGMIPDSGRNFRLPDPAWTDSRFNEESIQTQG